MKKTIAFLLALLMLLTLAGAALASSVPMDKEDQMVGLVKSFLEENEFPYEYDDYTFTVPFAVENSMEYVYMTVYIYDDMLAVSADAPVLTRYTSPAVPAIWWRTSSPGKMSCFTCSPCRRAIWRTTATASWRCSTAAIPTRRLKPVRRR